MTDTAPDPKNDINNLVERPRRMRTLKGAHAAFNHEFSAVPCTVRDESETGAKLQFDEAWWVPDQFTLLVEIDGYKVECEKVWHKGNLYGVRFTSEKMKTGMARRQSVDMIDFKNAGNVDDAAQKQSSDFANGPRRKQTGPSFGKLGR